MVKPPAKITIGSHEWTVKCDHASWSKQTFEQAEAPPLGYCDIHTLTIYLQPNQAPSLMQETLVHELLHACHALAGYDDAGKKANIEKFVTRTSPFLFDLVRRNPDLLEYLLDD